MYHAKPTDTRRGPVVGRPEVLEARPDLGPVWEPADAAFPVRVTRSWWDRIDLGVANDPLALQALPHPAELLPHADDLDDPVGDAACSPMPWVVHKYPDRVLLLLTKRCHLYCRYCFRRNHKPSEREDPTPEEWRAAVDYAAQSGATEVILSGGDPLAVRDTRLFEAIDALRGRVPTVRIHTRAPITRPSRVTPALVQGLASRGPVWMVVHCNHPQELSPEVDEALSRMVDAGLPVLNQAVLLRGVNDNVDTLVALSEALVQRRVFPYYLHHTDAARGNAHFRVSTKTGRGLYQGLRARVSGVALPRYVVDPPDGSGKRDV
jgi:lysine 2,3-aminomutase